MARKRHRRVGERLRALRRERGLSQEELGFRLRERYGDRAPTFGFIGHIERGVSEPSRETMELLADFFSVDPDEFVEYRIALLREALDYRHVGLGPAAAVADELLAAKPRLPRLAEAVGRLRRRRR